MSGRLNSSISPHRSSSQLTGPKPAPKPDPGAKSHKKYDVEAFEKEKAKGLKREKSSTTHRRNFGATIPIRPASSKLQETMKLRAEQQRRATLTQPLQCDLQTSSCKRSWKPGAQQQQRATMTQPLQCDLQAARYKRPKNYACNSDAE